MPDSFQPDSFQADSFVADQTNQQKLQAILAQRRSAPLPQVGDYKSVGSTPMRAAVESSLSDLGNMMNPVENVKGAFGEAGLWGALKSIPQMAPQNPLEAGTAAFSPAAFLTKKMYYDPALGLQGQAEQAARAGNMPEATFKATAATIPVVGLGVSAIYDLAKQGKMGQALGAGQFQVGALKIPDAFSAAREAAVGRAARSAVGGQITSTKPPVLSEAQAKISAIRGRMGGEGTPPTGNYRAAAIEGQRQTLAAGQEAGAKVLMENVQETHAAVKGALDTRWDALRAKVGDAPADPTKVIETEAQARTKYLDNATPDSAAKFDSIMAKSREPVALPENAIRDSAAQQLGYKDAAMLTKLNRISPAAFDSFVEKFKGMAGQEVNPLSFGQLRSQYTRLGDVLSSGNLPGDVYQAVKAVRAGLDSELTRVADANKAGGEYRALKAEHSQYMDDWRNTQSIPGGGHESPLAILLQAEDIPRVIDQVTGKSATRLQEQLARYSRQGAKPALAARMRAMRTQIKNLPTSVSPKSVPVPQTHQGVPLGVKIAARGGGVLASSVTGIHPYYGYHGGKLIEGPLARALAKRKK